MARAGRWWWGILALALASLAAPAIAQSVDAVNGRIDSILGPHARYATTIAALQQAVSDHSAADVAAFVRYPIRVAVNGRMSTINSAAAFVRNYDAIMMPEIAKAVKDQNYAELFVNDQGVMFGNGEVWLNRICLDRHCRQSVVKVVTIQNTAPNWGATGAAAASGL